jgi:acyl-CoA dehydrogenase
VTTRASALSAQEVALFRQTLTDLLADHCKWEVVRAAEASGMSYAPGLWHKLADLGFLGLGFAPEHGGIGAPWSVRCMVMEELGRNLAPAPIVPTILPAAQLIAQCGDEQLRETWLPRIIAGDCLVVSSVGPDPFTRTVHYKPGPVCAELRGELRSLPLLEAAEAVAVVAEEAGGQSHLCVIPSGDDGFISSPAHYTDGEKLWDVKLIDAPVALSAPLPVQVLSEALGLARLAHASWLVGAGQGALDRAVDYSKVRKQFGKQIGSFQALQHQMANAAMQLEAARRVVNGSAASIDAGGSAELVSRAARLLSAQAFALAARVSQQVHGGYGYAEDAEVQLYYRKSARLAFVLGDPTEETVTLGRLALGHPDLIGGIAAHATPQPPSAIV